MRKLDWLVAGFLILIGLSCLTMSATSMMNSESFRAYIHTFIKICLWLGLPALIGAIVYIFMKWKRGS